MIQRFIRDVVNGLLVGSILVALSCGSHPSEGASGASAGGNGSPETSAAGTAATRNGSSVDSGAASTGVGGTGVGTTGGSSGVAPASANGTGVSSTGTSTATSGGPGGPNSVLQRGNDLMRRETFLQPALTKEVAATMTMDAAFTAAATFGGKLAASVLYLENGSPAAGCPAAAAGCKATTRAAGNGIFFAATSGNTVYALDETSGAIVWSRALVGAGGDGIRGTPVVDQVTRALYVCSGGGGSHYVHALSVDDGTELTGWPVKLTASLTLNGTAFNSVDQNQHGALMFANGIVYVPFGGHIGDGGNYHGWVVAIQASEPTKVGGWVSAGGSEGIWAHGGAMTSDGTNIYLVTSNGHAADHTKPTTDSEEVVKFTGMGTFTRTPQNVYYPTNWKYMDGSDKDFGSSSPSYVPLPPGSIPSALIVAPAKPGAVYFLDANNLSSGKYPQPGGELQELTVGSTTTESVYAAPTVYQSASGLHAAIDVGIGAVCPAGGPQGDKIILSMLIQPGMTPLAKTVWCSSAAGNGGTAYNQPPISTTTDANGSNAIVWYTNGGGLMGVDGDTGHTVVSAPGQCFGMEKMMWPIAVKGRIVVGADGHLCAWSHP